MLSATIQKGAHMALKITGFVPVVYVDGRTVQLTLAEAAQMELERYPFFQPSKGFVEAKVRVATAEKLGIRPYNVWTKGA